MEVTNQILWPPFMWTLTGRCCGHNVEQCRGMMANKQRHTCKSTSAFSDSPPLQRPGQSRQSHSFTLATNTNTHTHTNAIQLALRCRLQSNARAVCAVCCSPRSREDRSSPEAPVETEQHRVQTELTEANSQQRGYFWKPLYEYVTNRTCRNVE